MAYEITIKEITTRTVQENGNWVVVDKRPMTTEEVLDSANDYSFRKGEKDPPLKEVYAYAPARDVLKSIELEVLKQRVEKIDLAAVIKAINGI